MGSPTISRVFNYRRTLVFQSSNLFCYTYQFHCGGFPHLLEEALLHIFFENMRLYQCYFKISAGYSPFELLLLLLQPQMIHEVYQICVVDNLKRYAHS